MLSTFSFLSSNESKIEINSIVEKTISKELLSMLKETLKKVNGIITTVSSLPGEEKNAERVQNARDNINKAIITQLQSRAASLTESLLLRFVINGLNIQKAGNCKEFSLYVYSLLIAQKIKCEIFRIKNGDHVFLVVNRDTSTPVKDYNLWNEEACVVDPFFNRIFSPKEIPIFLKSCLFNVEMNTVSYILFDPEKHELVNSVMREFLDNWREDLELANNIGAQKNSRST